MHVPKLLGFISTHTSKTVDAGGRHATHTLVSIRSETYFSTITSHPVPADMRHVPEAVALYDQLGVKKAPLSLIPPAFETPLPPLRPATFPPVLREPPPPALELFDLDEAFAGEQVRGRPCRASVSQMAWFFGSNE
jgi:hypothetical protein